MEDCVLVYFSRKWPPRRALELINSAKLLQMQLVCVKNVEFAYVWLQSQGERERERERERFTMSIQPLPMGTNHHRHVGSR